MEKYYRISEAANILGVCTKTIRRWDLAAKIVCLRTAGGHRRIALLELDRLSNMRQQPQPSHASGTAAIYGRVSSHEQKIKGDLERQIAIAKEYCTHEQIRSEYIIMDVGSGLNTHRVGLKKLCALIEQQLITQVILTYSDRLTRFGFDYLKAYFKSYGVEIQVIHQKSDGSLEGELVQDLIAIITSFSGRVHGLRSHKNRPKKAESAITGA